MIPQNVLSTTTIYADLLLEDPQPQRNVSREWGGVALQDPSQGLMVKIWTCTVVGDNIVVYADGVPETVLFVASNTTEVSLAFDQNMRPFVAFVQAGQAKYYWYDSAVEGTVISNLPVGSTSPRATLDDHRELEFNTSDIILVYIRDGNLYFRQQRDRYLTERILYPDINLVLIAPRICYVAMNRVHRLQILMEGVFHGQN